jgi:hypothetical protein
MPAPDIPTVMNGEGCPGCRTPIWGARPKRCFMCGYDFENPREEDMLENRARRVLEGEDMGDVLYAEIDTQRDRGNEVQEKLKQMTLAFLSHDDFPVEGSPFDVRELFQKFVMAEFFTANFPQLEVETWKDVETNQVNWRIHGEMDLRGERIVGIPFNEMLNHQL